MKGNVEPDWIFLSCFLLHFLCAVQIYLILLIKMKNIYGSTTFYSLSVHLNEQHFLVSDQLNFNTL